MSEVRDIVLKAFYNPTTGLTRNLAKLKQKNPQLYAIPLESIRSILDNYAQTYQENKPFKEVKKFVSYHANYIGELIHADLMFIKSPRNTNQFITIKDDEEDYKYILVCVDTYSRFLWCYTLETKSSDKIAKCLTEMVDTIREIFYEGYKDLNFNILTDAGKEFKFNIPNVKHIISKNQHGAVIAEAYIYKIREKIRYLDNTKTGKKKITMQELKQIIENINSDKLKGDVVTPNEIFFENKEPKEKVIKNHVISSIEQGDYVRIVNYGKQNNLFVKKSSVNNFDDRVLIVLYVIYHAKDEVFTYILGSINGRYILKRPFYIEELIKVPFSFMTSVDIEHNSKFTQDEIKYLKIEE